MLERANPNWETFIRSLRVEERSTKSSHSNWATYPSGSLSVVGERECDLSESSGRNARPQADLQVGQ